MLSSIPEDENLLYSFGSGGITKSESKLLSSCIAVTANKNEKETYMKVILINGSPHENGSTRAALDDIIEELQDNRIETKLYWVGMKAVHGCIACGKWAAALGRPPEPSVRETSPKIRAVCLGERTPVELPAEDAGAPPTACGSRRAARGTAGPTAPTSGPALPRCPRGRRASRPRRGCRCRTWTPASSTASKPCCLARLRFTAPSF